MMGGCVLLSFLVCSLGCCEAVSSLGEGDFFVAGSNSGYLRLTSGGGGIVCDSFGDSWLMREIIFKILY
jgi:hypothetical protein